MADSVIPTPIAELIDLGVLTINDGYRAKNSELSSTGLPFVRVQNINNGFHLEGADSFPVEDLHKVGNKISEPGDVVFTSKGTVGRFAFVREDVSRFVYSPQLCFWRVEDDELIHPRWLFYWMQSREFYVQFSGVAGQTDMADYVSLRDQRRMQIAIPPLPEQRAIAHILGALDDKIELNRRMNETLEAMARAIFKSWFVDFDPVRAKARGEQPAGLAPEIAALFPDALVETELGEMPEGWEVTSLAEQITATKGLSYKGQHLCEPGEGLPMHNLNSVYEGGGYKNEGLKWYNGEYRPAHLLKPGDVIVTNTEQGFGYLLIGYAAIVPKRYGPQGLFSHHIFRIQRRATSYLPEWFIYMLLRTQRFHDLVAGHSNGTTVNMLPVDGLQRPQFILPPREIVDHFGDLFAATQQRLECIYDENISLAALRDTLLPKLISGELRVADAERFVGATA